jgi:hypothetical protein
VPLDPVTTTPEATETATLTATPEGTTTPAATVSPDDGTDSPDPIDSTPTAEETSTETPVSTATPVALPVETTTATPEGTTTPDVTQAPTPESPLELTATPVETPVEIATPSPTPTVTPAEVTPTATSEATAEPIELDTDGKRCQNTVNGNAGEDADGEPGQCHDQNDPVPTPVVTPTAESASTDGGQGSVTPLTDSLVASDDLVPDDTASFDAGERTAAAEVNSTAETTDEADASDLGNDRQEPTGRDDGRKANKRQGDQDDPAASTAPVEPDRSDRPVDDWQLPEDSGLDPEEKKRRESDTAAVIAGDTDPDVTARADNGDKTDRRNEARSDLEAGGNPEPEASPNQEIASTLPQDDGSAQDDKRGSDAKATHPDDPDAEELAENQVGGAVPTDEIAPADQSSAADDPALVTDDAPLQDVASPGAEEDVSESGPREGQGAEPSTQSDEGSQGLGRANASVDQGSSSQSADDNKAYRIVKTRQSRNSGDAVVVVDNDPATSWSTEPGATPHEAYVVLDLGKPRVIKSVRWLAAPEGLSGTLRVEVSTDGKQWQKAAGVGQDTTDAWQERRLKQAVEARYVRLVFKNPNQEPRLGGLAEVEVWPAAKATAQRGSPTQERDRADAGSSKAKSGDERAKSGKQGKGDKDRNGGKSSKKEKDRKKQKADHKRGHRGRR